MTMTGTTSHVPPCRGCAHRLPTLADQGHPTPCRRVRWLGQTHYLPRLAIGASGVVTCGDFLPSQTKGTPTQPKR